MVELVTDDHILRCQDALKQPGVRVEARRIQYCVCRAVERRYLPLQLLVEVLRTMVAGVRRMHCWGMHGTEEQSFEVVGHHT